MQAEKLEIVFTPSKKKTMDAGGIFRGIKDVLDKDKNEYLNSAIFTMVIDSLEKGGTLARFKQKLETGDIEEDFEILVE